MTFLKLVIFFLASQAAVAAPSTPAGPLCPAANSTVHKAGGASFTIECGTDHYGGDMTAGYGQPAASLHGCMQRCAAQQGCLAVAYANGACYLKSTLTAATADANVDSAMLAGASSSSGSTVSATSVQAEAVQGTTTMMLTKTTMNTVTVTKTGTPPSGTPASVTADAAAPSTNPAGNSGCARPAAKALAGKRGLCYNDASMTTFFGSKVTWAYNWGQTAGSGLAPSLEYSPMLWSGLSSNTGSWASNAKSAIAGGCSVLLGFNEPDLSTQAHMTVAEAVSAWQQFMEPLACSARLAAPAVTNGGAPFGLAWLSSFLESCQGCSVDVIPIHWFVTLLHK
jgi:hypothetical protein